ncbi:2-phospho-L-lactate guanylyltransferase [Pseudonocardia nematodicida]
MTPWVDLVVPVKPLPRAKTRLRGAADGGVGDLGAHQRLALALARDTVAAAVAAGSVRSVLVISSDPAVAMEVGALGVEVVTDPGRGLNGALRHGAALLRARSGGAPGSSGGHGAPGGAAPGPRGAGIAIGALQADLPALRTELLDDAVADAAHRFATGATRVFVPDAPGTGTTLLLAAPGHDLAPHFGGASAAAHTASGAVALDGDRPGLRRDVDTAADLDDAVRLGVGEWTRAVLDGRPAGVPEPGVTPCPPSGSTPCPKV